MESTLTWGQSVLVCSADEQEGCHGQNDTVGLVV